MSKFRSALFVILMAFPLTSTDGLSQDFQYYGRVDYSLTHSSSGSATHNGVEGTSLENNFSLLGVRGSEKLNRQWDFVFQMEFGVSSEDQDNTGNPFTSRPTFAGVAGPWGRLTVGFMDPVFKLTKGFVDAFDNYSTKHDRLVPGDKPHGDSVQYWSPRHAGFRLGGTLLLEDEYFAAGDPRLENGNYQVAATYGDKFFRSGNLYLATAYSAGVEDIEAWRMVLNWKAGPWRLGGMFQQSKQVNSRADAYDDRDGVGFFTGAVYVAGDWRFKVQAGADKSGCGFIARRIYEEHGADVALVPEIRTLAVGVEYFFTGRLRLHGELGSARVENVRGYRNTFDDDLFSLGMRFEF
jgi:outer membrane pore protein F